MPYPASGVHLARVECSFQGLWHTNKEKTLQFRTEKKKEDDDEEEEKNRTHRIYLPSNRAFLDLRYRQIIPFDICKKNRFTTIITDTHEKEKRRKTVLDVDVHSPAGGGGSGAAAAGEKNMAGAGGYKDTTQYRRISAMEDECKIIQFRQETTSTSEDNNIPVASWIGLE